jgi:hypothetical protein
MNKLSFVGMQLPFSWSLHTHAHTHTFPKYSSKPFYHQPYLSQIGVLVLKWQWHILLCKYLVFCMFVYRLIQINLLNKFWHIGGYCILLKDIWNVIWTSFYLNVLLHFIYQLDFAWAWVKPTQVSRSVPQVVEVWKVDQVIINLIPRACNPREGTWGSGIIRFREESDWLLKWIAQFNLSQDSWLPATDYPRASRSFPRIAGLGNEIELSCKH